MIVCPLNSLTHISDLTLMRASSFARAEREGGKTMVGGGPRRVAFVGLLAVLLWGELAISRRIPYRASRRSPATLAYHHFRAIDVAAIRNTLVPSVSVVLRQRMTPAWSTNVS